MSSHYPADYDVGRTASNPAVRLRYETQAAFVGRGPGTLLDIGTARGDFLDIAERYSWRAFGLDPYARDGATDSRVIKMELHDIAFPPGSFDVVTAWQVVEHSHSPSKFFKHVSQLLRPGGRFCVSVPNFNSYHARWLKAEDVPRHLYFLTLDSLAAFGRESGFGIAKHSYAADFAHGAEGRGAFTRPVYCWLGGLSLYEYHRVRTSTPNALRQRFPVRYQFARPLNRLERRLLDPKKLEAAGRMGVVAVEYVKN